MADQKITELTALATPDPADLLAIVDDVAGTPITKKITVANLLGDYVSVGGDTMTGQLKTANVYPSLYHDDTAGYAAADAAWMVRRRLLNDDGLHYGLHSYNESAGAISVSDRLTGIQSTVGDHASVVNKTITGMSRSGTTVTVTSTAHGFSNGDRIAIYGVTSTFDQTVNGAWTVANVAANTFDITVPSLSSGAYTSGGTATNRPMQFAFSATVIPTLARGSLTGTAVHADDLAAYSAYNAGSAKGTDAYYLGRNSSIVGSEWGTIFTSDAFSDYGIRLNGTIVNAGIYFGGSYAIGIDLGAGTYSSYPIRLPNNKAIVGLNNAGSGNVVMFYVNTLDEVQMDTTVRWTASQIIGNTANFTFSTSTGTKIGTATTQKIGFWNATPIAQPANTTDLRAVLINTGLLASGGANPLDLNGGALTAAGITLADATNIVVDTTTGTKIGTATTQKLGFFNATPIVQPANTTDLRTALINLGLYATGGASPLDLNGGAFIAGSVRSPSASGGIGYATGAGGAVTQATNKSTGVTLNTICGAITMANGNLAAAAEVAFVVTNSAVAARDVVVASIASGATTTAYQLTVTAVAAGSFTLNLANLSTGTLNENPVINFAVIKAVNS